MPDQWLIVRFYRRGDTFKTRSWFLDSGLVTDSSAPTNLLFTSEKKYVARNVGKAVPLEEYSAAKLKGSRTRITAIGNAQTGSPTFTAFIEENRNILSWRDDLDDLREPDKKGKVPPGTTLSYLLMGWYRDQENEPFAALPGQIPGESGEPPSAADVLEALGWSLDRRQSRRRISSQS